MSSPLAQRVARPIVAFATAIALLGLAIPLFLNPAWVTLEQDRSRVDAITGYTPAEVHRVTGGLLHDLVLGPPVFDVTDDAGRPVLEERERAHLRDVRAVFGGAVVVVAASLLVVGAGLALARSAPGFWQALRGGARALAVAVVVLGVISAVAFDAAFELFHRLLFAGGTYTFDPRSERLVQLFPDQFWSETTIALGVALVVLALAVDRFAGGRLRALAARPAVADGPSDVGDSRESRATVAAR